MKNKEVRYIFLAVGIFILAFVAYQNLPRVSYLFGQKKLEKRFVSSVKKTKYPKKFLAKPMPTKLVIPSIKFDQQVLYAAGDNKSQTESLKKGATHLGGTPLPGQLGNVLIGGHYSRYTFKELTKVRVGDTFKLITPIQEFHYKVIKTKDVKQDTLKEVKGYGSKKKRFLTLYTCVFPSVVTKARSIVVAKQIKP